MEILEPNAMEKFAMEKKDGVVVERMEKGELEPTTPIIVTIKVGEEERVYELDTLFFIGLPKGGYEENTQTTDAAIALVGKYDENSACTIVKSIETVKKNTPQLMKADMIRMLHGISSMLGGDKQ